ncbi:hypothetical protein sscle_07g058710 [Sclerotinia sclerotiorum 1980 UF-70]|uniref:Cyclin-like domain-containing protein n=1 Tax=Sclerotinia sclerotiorum (strain ATCC 18683 / 1980 / Ss-1) TaxID=665079 RepID=A0A1D9Q846_SCLS1|nr:hypothetical protein sscle_07g058710 [Sclerotinia sclerotiorum 1980 UF-70]
MHQTSVRPAPFSFLLPPTPQTPFGIDRRKDVGFPLTLPQINQSGYIEAPVRVGLRTPPEDDMHATYPGPPYPHYKGRHNETCTESLNFNRASDHDGSATQSRISQAPGDSVHRVAKIVEPSQAEQPYNWPTVKPKHTSESFYATALTTLESESTRKPQAKKPNTDTIHPSLQIPKSINDSGGSLAEFAAQITCLFWFESTDTLKRAENSWAGSTTIERLRPEAFPSVGFTKWVVTILMTTQVSQNVILLALLFIYRLKSINPVVKGRSGSEYRLLTVALMLGNKFLDDNTYTNKTWAEVSGISVTEIHIMEVEFLSNMRYSLLATEDEWKEWQRKLGKFGSFCDRAVKLSPPPMYQPTLPSPPASMQASSPTQTSQYASPAGSYNLTPQWPAISNAAQLVSPLTTASTPSDQDFHANAKKRSFLEDAEEPVAKRVSRSITSTSNCLQDFNMTPRPRLPPVPNLTISTNQAMSGNNGLPSFSQNAPTLPPLNINRAMSTVYPTTPTYPPPILSHTLSGSQTSGSQVAAYQHNNQIVGTPCGQRSPRSAVQELLASVPSPLNASFPGTSGHISPSVFYQQRNSPYKPIRHVNTLLYPPPSTSMHDYAVNTNHMHYQPLGKRHDYRSGVVPGYGHQSANQWPVLPQPNFHGV